MSNLPVYIPRLTRRQFLRIGAVAIAGYDLMPMICPVNVVAKERVKPRGTADFCLFVLHTNAQTRSSPAGRIVPQIGPEVGSPGYCTLDGNLGDRARSGHLLLARGSPSQSSSGARDAVPGSRGGL